MGRAVGPRREMREVILSTPKAPTGLARLHAERQDLDSEIEVLIPWPCEITSVLPLGIWDYKVLVEDSDTILGQGHIRVTRKDVLRANKGDADLPSWHRSL